uniref:Small ribosomal subunit protein uS15c n=4 Tax=Isoetes TaxID=13838 RepID=A0A343URJ1_9TRAC|nr:ribosomal protein S15 [Isoetes cangae]YP_009515299.1 ribosomal protein S15 [Isoetes serracarajensis]YP_010589126.1 ribosomal protein S15 [Isoetes cubana]YP_010589196.1 ribosomal protein S15 [Isoetes pallida]QUS64626.1 ribosomal protein S15 [Isoetes anamariae]QUS64790.1 ribosomal protein S15 [Isoetes longifolia]QUS64872.1 ribosomal protein S15 [Isoetes luetzelburgii]QUS64954.1 ribosomal protein S15 [Isoetes cipoensis]QUS65036.1 ribosomal protein S15 [Isoetes harleyi]QUS65118.1 ribosomal 
MAKNILIRSSLVPEKQTGSVEFQISHLTNRILKPTYHLKLHGKDYSSQRGLWKIPGKRERLLAHLSQKNSLCYENLINQLRIRGLKKR